MPGRSRDREATAALPGRTLIASAMRMMDMGTLIRKSHCQPKGISTAPMIGPTTKAAPNIAPRAPSAAPRFSGATVSPMAEAATGNMPPPPKP